MSIEEKYEKLAKDTRTVLRAIKRAVSGDFGRFETDRDIFYVSCVGGELYLFKADQRLGSARLYQDTDYRFFLNVCLGYMEDEDY